jgi:hypothetical protein
LPNSSLINEINQAIGAHGAWKMRLRTAINTGTGDITVADASHEALCAFGKWLTGPSVSPAVRAGVPYQVVRRLHAEFHQIAGQVLAEALRGRREEASILMEGPFAAQSEKLVRALTKWKNELTQMRIAA